MEIDGAIWGAAGCVCERGVRVIGVADLFPRPRWFFVCSVHLYLCRCCCCCVSTTTTTTTVDHYRSPLLQSESSLWLCSSFVNPSDYRLSPRRRRRRRRRVCCIDCYCCLIDSATALLSPLPLPALASVLSVFQQQAKKRSIDSVPKAALFSR